MRNLHILETWKSAYLNFPINASAMTEPNRGVRELMTVKPLKNTVEKLSLNLRTFKKYSVNTAKKIIIESRFSYDWGSTR